MDLDQNAKSLLPTTWWQNHSMAELVGQQAVPSPYLADRVLLFDM